MASGVEIATENTSWTVSRTTARPTGAGVARKRDGRRDSSLEIEMKVPDLFWRVYFAAAPKVIEG
jgi:hypothetical protein